MLIGAGIRAGGSPMRLLGAPLAHSAERNTWAQAGALRNIHAGEATVISGADISAKAGYPTGCLPPASWSLPRKPGGMSSRFEAGITITATGLAVGGVNISGGANMAFGAAGEGELIAFGQGTAAMTFGASGTMAGTVQVSGGASFGITTNAPILGALANGSGTAAMTFGATADALPADDTPPARTASAAFAFSAGATLRAIGHMSGSTDVATELTAAAIAAEVLAAAAAAPIAANVEKVRGQALEGTGTELDPWGPA
jgi:hypothetical protein